MRNNRRGSYMAEAAIVLPIVILAVITLILILTFFYEQSIRQSQLHMALRAESGIASGKMTCETVNWDGQITKTRQGIYHVVRGSREISMGSRGLLKEPGLSTVEGTWRITDGPRHVRRWR